MAEEPNGLSDEQVAALDRIVAERHEELEYHGIYIRAWWRPHGEDLLVIEYTGHGQLTEAMVKPFLVFGPETVRFEHRPPRHFFPYVPLQGPPPPPAPDSDG
jgi:hypothetical protein